MKSKDLKSYREEVISKFGEPKRNPLLAQNINQYMYSFMQESNIGHDDDIALQYMGVKITFGELNKKIDEYARALLDLGVKKGEIVSLCMPSTPETVILMYALNKIGAVSNFIDLTRDDEYIKHCINNVDSKMLITYNGILPKIGRIVDETKLDNVVYVSALESLPLVKKGLIEFLGKVTGKLPDVSNFTNDSGFLGWDQFLKLSKSSKTDIIVPDFVKEQLSFIEYTSGTTGIPKAIELTNDCANLKPIQYSQSNLIYDRQDAFLNIIPVFVAFGVIMGIQLPLSLGFRDELIAAYDKNDIIKYFKNTKPNHFMLVPSSYSYFVNHPKFNTLDLSYTKTLGCGGDGLNESQNKIIVDKFAEQGGVFEMTNGYGASELGAPFSTCTWEKSKYGSVGIPLPGNEIFIFKPGTMEKLGPNEIGDICMVVDYPMIKYHSDEESTNKVMIPLENGKIGIMLGDMGYVDEDGFIFVKGRKTDIINTEIGDIWPVDYENFIMSSNLVRLAAFTKIENSDTYKLFVEPAIGQDDGLTNKLLNFINNSDSKFKNIHIDIEIVESIPLTLTGKIDRKKIKVNLDNVRKLK